MNRRALIDRITAANGGKIFVTQSQAAKILGIGRASFRDMMTGYDYKVGGKGGAKRYLVDDVAEAVMRS